MRMLHDREFRGEIQNRIRALTPDTKPVWGKMSADQMLWHVNGFLELALGQIAVDRRKIRLPGPLLKFVVLHLPWGKGAPTLPSFVAREHHDFEREKAKCLNLINDFAARDLNGSWAPNPLFGEVTGYDVTRLQAKHLDHHLRQFGV